MSEETFILNGILKNVETESDKNFVKNVKHLRFLEFLGHLKGNEDDTYIFQVIDYNVEESKVKKLLETYPYTSKYQDTLLFKCVKDDKRIICMFCSHSVEINRVRSQIGIEENEASNKIATRSFYECDKLFPVSDSQIFHITDDESIIDSIVVFPNTEKSLR